jgi:hypothetical protein
MLVFTEFGDFQYFVYHKYISHNILTYMYYHCIYMHTHIYVYIYIIVTF